MLELLKKTMGKTRTENNAVSYNTTGNEVLNLFALGGAVRSRTEIQIATLIKSAWEEDKLLALKTIFYLGDIREGQGERNFLKVALVWLAFREPNIVRQVLSLIPFYSRWDVMYSLVGTPVEKDVFALMKNQFDEDLQSEKPSLLGKWLKSVNTSNKESRELGAKTAKYFGLTHKEYRQKLALLRKKINVVETLMSSKDWENIDLKNVTGLAYRKYIKAFQRHLPNQFTEFIEKVESGEIQMKSKVLYPYQIIQSSLVAKNSQEFQSAELQWRDLPDYIGDNQEYIIPVIDTSGSMESNYGTSVQPIVVAKSLGIYVSERLKGPFKDHYITFSSRPILERIKGITLAQKYLNMAELVDNTNIEAVFDLILQTAVNNNVAQEEMPTKILILSDMEFDQATESPYYRNYNKIEKTLFEKIEERYKAYGYNLPQIMFWNLSARNDQFPMRMDDRGIALVSGFSPVIMKHVLAGDFISPYDIMLKTINTERYSIFDEIVK